jgi:hypothetical protein
VNISKVTLLVGARSEIGREILRGRLELGEKCLSLGRDQISDSLHLKSFSDSSESECPDFHGNLTEICEFMSKCSISVSTLILSTGYMSDPKYQSETNQITTSFLGNVDFPYRVLRSFQESNILSNKSTVVLMSTSLFGLPLQKKHYVYQSMKELLEKITVKTFIFNNRKNTLLIVRPGHVPTKLNNQIPSTIFSTNSKSISKNVMNWMKKNSTVSGVHTIYSPQYLKWLVLIARILPISVFQLLVRNLRKRI